MSKALRDRWKNDSFTLQVKESIKPIFADKVLHQQADLRGIIVGLDGAIPELIHANFCDVNLSGQLLNHSMLSCSFSDGIFSRVDFGSSHFDTCRLLRSRFHECSFNCALLNSPTFDDALFEGRTFHGAKISGRGFTEYGGRRATFKTCGLNNCLFKNVQIRGCKFIDCDFQATSFDNCIITGTSFLGSAPPSAAFSDCEGQAL